MTHTHTSKPYRPLPFQYDDGGRKAAGYKGNADDCVTRAIAIAAQLDYQTVYELINAHGKQERRYGKRDERRRSTARTGVRKTTTRRVLTDLGWTWVPTMMIGSGCKVHLAADELPMRGRLIVSVSKHLTAVIDGVIHDTHDPSREPIAIMGPRLLTDPDGTQRNEILSETGGRCVYGYWIKD